MTNVYICGVANSGKTTLFNGLARRNERVGNWCGVTTRAVSGHFSVQKGGKRLKFTLTDLPGSYLDDYTLDQDVTLKNIADGGVVLVVCRAKNLVRGLSFLKKLTQSLSRSSVVLVVNAYEELRKAGGKIDFGRLQAALGITVIQAECNTHSGIKIVKNAILTAAVKTEPSVNSSANSSSNSSEEPSAKSTAQPSVLRDFEPLNVAKAALTFCRAKSLSRLDDFFLRPAFCFCTFFGAVIVVLYLAFGKYGIGEVLSVALEDLLARFFVLPLANLVAACKFSRFLSGFIIEGVVGGAVSVLSFLPRLAVIGVFNYYVEESGILARLAFTSDAFLSRFGLTGRAVFALLTGFGCTALAVDAAGGLENEGIKRRTVAALPFVCCSAKVPVFAWLFTEISHRNGFIAVFAVWALGLALALVFSFLHKRQGAVSYNGIIVEFTEYRRPSLKEGAKALLNFTKSFIIRVGTVITLVTAFLWLLRSISPDLRFLPPENAEESLLVFFAEKLQVIFYPAGVKNWRFAVAALAGLFAKENVLSVLMLLGVGEATAAELFAFMLFYAFYPPCISALIAVLKQAGVRCFLHVFCFHAFLALAAFYSVLKPAFIVLPTAVLAVAYFTKRLKSGERTRKKSKTECARAKFRIN